MTDGEDVGQTVRMFMLLVAFLLVFSIAACSEKERRADELRALTLKAGAHTKEATK